MHKASKDCAGKEKMKEGRFNHRVVRFRSKHETLLVICEVYYDEKGKPRMARQVTASTNWTLADLRQTLCNMQKAFKAPVLESTIFGKRVATR